MFHIRRDRLSSREEIEEDRQEIVANDSIQSSSLSSSSSPSSSSSSPLSRPFDAHPMHSLVTVDVDSAPKPLTMLLPALETVAVVHPSSQAPLHAHPPPPPPHLASTDEIPLKDGASTQSVSLPKTTLGISEVSIRRPRPSSTASSGPSESSVCRLCLLNEQEAEEKLTRLQCSCKGSVKFIHKSCAKRWMRVRGDRPECEMCGGKMITETFLERFLRRTTTRCHNATYKETVVAFSLLAFIFWLFSYCIYLFTKGVIEALMLRDEIMPKDSATER